VRHDPNVLYVGEGLTQSVVVSQSGGFRIFHVSGKIEASTSPRDMRLQRMLGHLPALIHPRPRSVLIVGCGAGVTAGTFTLYPGIERIVICEIEPLVPRRAARFFAAENYDVTSDPRVEVVIDDARHYILTTREKFDIITSDPIHPWVRGSASLYSRDYFELVRQHLNPGGVVSQWLPLYQASIPTVRSEMATFFSAFPNGTVWCNGARGQDLDLVMLSDTGERAIDLDALEQRLRQPDHRRAAESLEAVGFRSAMDLMATYTGRRRDLVPWLAGARVNRDRQPWLQYQAGLDSYAPQQADVYGEIVRYRVFPEDLFAGSEQPMEELKAAVGADP
jgi:spermidine synthase